MAPEVNFNEKCPITDHRTGLDIAVQIMAGERQTLGCGEEI